MSKYVAVVYFLAGAYYAIVPDIPEVHCSGENIREALDNASDELDGAIVMRRAFGEIPPEPSCFSAAMKLYRKMVGEHPSMAIKISPLSTLDHGNGYISQRDLSTAK